VKEGSFEGKILCFFLGLRKSSGRVWKFRVFSSKYNAKISDLTKCDAKLPGLLHKKRVCDAIQKLNLQNSSRIFGEKIWWNLTGLGSKRDWIIFHIIERRSLFFEQEMLSFISLNKNWENFFVMLVEFLIRKNFFAIMISWKDFHERPIFRFFVNFFGKSKFNLHEIQN